MKKTLFLVFILSLFFSCKLTEKTKKTKQKSYDFTIAFGSCNKQNKTNVLWKEIEKNNPNLWVWGGDIIYSDTENMQKMKQDYDTQKKQKGYDALLKSTPIMATWDDHDYGVNDGGIEFAKKEEAQQLFLDFLNVDKNSPRRKQEGVYHSKLFKTSNGSVKVIVLDTRYFRTALTKNKTQKRRYEPNSYGKGSILGNTQWNWLQQELSSSEANFNVIVSSIQVLSAEHGFETWGNFPHEVDKLKQLIVESKAKGVVLISGDRHISEFSKTSVKGLSYPLIDFTSSGLTHSYKSYSGEPNSLRVKNVISDISFGLMHFNFKTKKINLEMRGINNKLLQEINQTYP
jgi:alkaline phosphatase D